MSNMHIVAIEDDTVSHEDIDNSLPTRLSADNFCKQFGSRSGPTKGRAWSGSKLFDTQMIFLTDSFRKVDFEKKQQTTKKHAKISQ